MADKTLNKVQLNIKWKKDASSSLPALLPAETTAYVKTTLSSKPSGWPTGYYTDPGGNNPAPSTYANGTYYLATTKTDGSGYTTENLVTTLGKVVRYLSDATTHYGTCDTAAATAEKAVTCSGFNLVTGAQIVVRFTVTNTAAVADLKLNVNGTGAKSIKYRNANLSSVGYLAVNRTYMFVYDGTYYQLMGDLDTNSNDAVKQNATTTNAAYEVLFSYSANNTTETKQARKNSNLTFNPSTGNLTVTQLNGVTVGSSPKFTDTTYTLSGAASSNNQFVVTLRPSSGSATTATVPVASTSGYGITKLSSSTSSTSEALAATPKAVKAAYDLAASKTANTGTVTSITAGTGLSGGTIDESGTIAINFGNSGESQLAARADHVHDNVLYTTDNITINCITDDPTTAVRYGVRIAKNDSNPHTRVTYMYDALGFTPARMVYNTSNPENSYFSYGSWADAFFVRNNYPCMCRYDGTEDYELSHQDHTKKIDGTDSDVTDMSYAGNAQSCFDCKIWLWHHEDADYEYYEISNVQYNENFHLNAYVRADGTVADKVYFPMYKGSYDGTRLRSMSSPTVLTDDGVYPQNKTNYTDEINYCAANGEKWQIGDWAHRELLNALLVLISKSDNSQEAFGQGCTEGGSDNALIHYGFPKNGSLNMKGQFFGYSSTRKAVKVFYIENWWGTRWDRCLGLFNDKGEYKVKWTPPYSNTSTTGCISTGITVPATGWQKATSNTYGRLPVSTGSPGSASTYTCDYFWSNNAQLNLALCGGSAGNGSTCGAWFVAVNATLSDSDWNIGASPYLK